MTLTLLLDLDDTLLVNEMGQFLPAYARLLAQQFAGQVEPEILVKQLFAASGLMVQNTRPNLTLEEAFDRAFYPAIGLAKETALPLIEDFYRRVFPSLRGLTRPVPGAAQIVRQALERGYQVAIATNPLFPRTAIEQRLEWAGLPVEEILFALVPGFEEFHFAKPNPAYFAEVLARLGWPEGPVVVVGDSIENDLIPARQIGLATYWTPATSQELVSQDGGFEPDGKGAVSGLLDWIDALGEEKLAVDYTSPSSLLAILRSTPAVFSLLAKTLPIDAWLRRPEPEEWSLAEVVCHLRDVEAEVNVPRLHKMLAEANPFIPGADTDPWVQARDYISQDCLQATGDFVAARDESLAILTQMDEASWQRMARHAILGPTQLREIVGITASHDRLHIQQAYSCVDAVQQENQS